MASVVMPPPRVYVLHDVNAMRYKLNKSQKEKKFLLDKLYKQVMLAVCVMPTSGEERKPAAIYSYVYICVTKLNRFVSTARV